MYMLTISLVNANKQSHMVKCDPFYILLFYRGGYLLKQFHAAPCSRLSLSGFEPAAPLLAIGVCVGESPATPAPVPDGGSSQERRPARQVLADKRAAVQASARSLCSQKKRKPRNEKKNTQNKIVKKKTFR